MSESHDELTGVHHRRSFNTLLRRQITLANESRSSLALLVVDIDKFAHINAAYGFEFGDLALKHVATQLRRVTRGHDFLARIGSDRFALILPRMMNRGHAELAVQKVLRLLDVPFEAESHRLRISATIGVALCPFNATHADFLLRNAEHSLETARAAGLSYDFAADKGEEEAFSEYWDIELDLAGAHDRGEMFMYYQPKVRCDDRRVVGAEALMRWRSGARGFISPGVFIPVAEQTGQIKALTIWAMNMALRQAAAWKHEHGPLTIAVNVPPELVTQHDLPELVENALHLWGEHDVGLVLEVTERSLITDPKHSFKILSQIRDLGVKVSIDDFGTGYSCLAYFKNIPCDELKIDRSFITGLLEDRASKELTSLIIDLAHRFGMNVVAEGVEDEATLAALAERGCDVAQGYVIAPALASQDFERWLQTGSADAAEETAPFELPADFPWNYATTESGTTEPGDGSASK